MNRVAVVNLSVLLLALAVSLSLAWPHSNANARRIVLRGQSDGATRLRVSLGNGDFAVADASRHLVRLRRYQRIVSTNLVTDRLLVELCEPARILAVSRSAAERKRDGYRYQGLRTVDGFGPVEAILALQPDLVLTNSFGAPGSSDRLRSAGVEVFDLGELRGNDSLSSIAWNLGELLGAPDRAERFVQSFTARMHNVSARLGTRQPVRAMFLSTLGPDLQGGTRGTSYHDILTAAGLIDVAAEQYRDWPAYSAEQVLALSPDTIVTGKASRRGSVNTPAWTMCLPAAGRAASSNCLASCSTARHRHARRGRRAVRAGV